MYDIDGKWRVVDNGWGVSRIGAIVIVAALAMATLLLIAGSTTLWDRDEPRFARAAVEMVRSGNYLVPTFNGDWRVSKPILIYWLMSAAVRAFGVSELAVRFFSAVGIVCSGVLTFFIGRRLFDYGVGLLGMAILLTCALTLYIGSAAMSDGVLLACTTLAMFVFVDIAFRGLRWWSMPLLTIALALGLLAKGPVGLVTPAMTIVAVGFAGRREFNLRSNFWLAFVAAVVIGVSIFLMWGVPANIRSGGKFLEIGIGEQVLRRMVHAMEGHGGRGVVGYLACLPLYIPLLFLGFLPWSMHVPGAISAMLSRRIGDRRSRTILWCWLVPTFLMMTLVATKLPHYILPVYPPLAIATAATVLAARRGETTERDDRWLKSGVWFVAPVVVIVALALALSPLILPLPRVWLAAPLAVAAIVVAAIALRWQWRLQVLRSSVLTAAAMPALVALGIVALAPAVESNLKISPAIAATVRSVAAPGTAIAMSGYCEPSLVFYLDQPVSERVAMIPNSPESIAQWLREDAPGILIAQRRQLDEAMRRSGPFAETMILASRSTLNYSSRGMSTEVVVVGRHLPGSANVELASGSSP